MYDNGSSDNTINIVKQYTNTNLVQGDFIGFGATKNKASSYAKYDWVFSIDSDEVLSDKLIDELKTIQLDDIKTLFQIKRDNYFFDTHIRYSGWGNDWLIRLYNKNHHSFNDNIVHEFIEPKSNSKIVRLKNSFSHNAVIDIDQFLYKVIRYSNLASQNKKTCSFIVVLLKSCFAFIRTFILQLGFLDGYKGFVIAVSNFNGKFFRYTKRYINCKES